MTRIATALLAVALAAGPAGCFVTDARQTLLHLDGRTLVVEGRRDVCLRAVDDDSGEVLEEACDIVEDPLGMSEYAVFDAPDGGSVLVGIAPVDVTEVVVTADGREVAAELVGTDLVAALYLARLPAGVTQVTVVGRTAGGEPVDDPVEVDLPR